MRLAIAAKIERRNGTMEQRRLITIGCLALFLSLVLCGVTYGADSGNARFGKNVVVPTGETVSGALAACGANIQVLGNVQGRLRACGANVVIPGDVQGDLRAYGANVNLAGKYHGKVKAAAANLILAGVFDGDVEVVAARIIVAPTAVLKGNLIYVSADLNIQKGSRIMGEIVQRQTMAKKEKIEKWGREGIKALVPVGIFFWFISIAALIIVGVLINYLFPKRTNAVISALSQSPWKNLGFGLIFLVVVPVAIVISLITVVGIPAGVIAGLLYGIAIYISSIYIGVWMGRKILGYLNKSMTTAFFWPLVVGIIVISLLSMIPFIGWLFRLFVLLLSLGALSVTMWKMVAAPAPARKKAPRKIQRKTRKKR
jgi:cytoskeletal protein CcmA (bactofilin family)